MITLYQIEHLPFEDIERIAYACDDNFAVNIKQIRALAQRAIKARAEDQELIQRLQNENTALQVEIEELRESEI